MPPSPLTLVCFAVKEEAAPFKAAIGSRQNIQILLTGMGQRNADRSISSALSTQKPTLVLTCGFAGALNPDFSLGTVLFSCDEARLQLCLLAAGALLARFHCANRVASTAAEKRQL